MHDSCVGPLKNIETGHPHLHLLQQRPTVKHFEIDSSTCLFLSDQQQFGCVEYFSQPFLAESWEFCLHFSAVAEEVWMMWLRSDAWGSGRTPARLLCCTLNISARRPGMVTFITIYNTDCLTQRHNRHSHAGCVVSFLLKRGNILVWFFVHNLTWEYITTLNSEL